MITKIKQFIEKRKLASGIIIILFILGVYFGFKVLKGNTVATNYVLAAVERGTIITSVSGSGQVSASNQIDIKSKTSGDVISVNVKNGQEVKAGSIIAQIDSSDAQRAVREAGLSLEAAKVQLEELLKPVDELTILQAENALAKAKEAKQTAEDNINGGYEDAFNAVTDAFFDLPTIMIGLNNILYSYGIANSEKTLSGYWNISALINSINIDNRYELERFIKSAEDDYEIARAKYDKNFKNYRDTGRYSEHDAIETLLGETIETVKVMAETVKSEINMLDFWVDSRKSQSTFSTVTSYQSDLKSYTSKTTNYVSSLLNVQRAFKGDRADVVDAEYLIREKELALKNLKEGPDDLDIRTQKNAIQQKEENLATARENLAGCYVRAQFDGVITGIDVKKGDTVSSSTIIATLLTKQKVAEISLNELDVAKVKIGQKSTLTFDAINGLTITGEVSEADIIGTVTQGVVNYSVKIGFDMQDDRIKSGMTVSAAIITDSKQNVLLVPNSAIKSSGDISYVETPNEKIILDAAATGSGIILNTVPGQQQIQVGLVNDSYAEIVSGLSEGDEIIVKTINSSATTSTQSTQNGFRMPGGGFRD